MPKIWLAAFLTVFATAAVAQPPTQDGAAQLAASLHAWTDQLLGPAAPDLPVQATVEGDHYRVTVPLVAIRTKSGEPALTAAAQEKPDGSWQISDVQVPAQFALGGPGGETQVSIGHQQTSGIADPSLRTPSTIRSDVMDLHTSAIGPAQTSEQQIQHVQLNASLRAARDGLLDLTEESIVDGWQSGTIDPAGLAAGTGVRHGRAELTLQGITPDRVAPAVQALTALAFALPPPSIPGQPSGTRPEMTPELRDALGHLVIAASGLARAFRMNESLDGVQLELAGIGRAAAEHSSIGMGGESAGGLLRAWFELGMDGLVVPGLPAGMASLVPKRISFRPSISGVPVGALEKLLTEATGQNRPDVITSDIDALFSQGSLTAGIEALSFAIGPAEFAGAGSLLLLSATEHEGQARLTATGFDALIQESQGDPSLGQVTPVLVLARGLAKREGDHLVWTINATRDGSVMVNGMDFSSLMGAGRTP